MSLFTTYTEANKLTSSGLSVTYRQLPASCTNPTTGETVLYWEVTRMAKKSYSFVGMDEATAYECASAKRAQYTRAFARLDAGTLDPLTSLPTMVNVRECPSDIAPQHGDSAMWHVQISVNEEDVKAVAAPVSDPASLFSAANSRAYDEDAGAATLTLSSASRSGGVLTISYSQHIANFSEGAMVLQYKTSESSDSWTSVVGPPFAVPETGTLYVRLVYGGIESETLVVD